MINLRIRSEFSFKTTFGPIQQVADACKATGASSAAVVDGGTWSHVRWAAACAKAGIRPIFGTELTVPTADDRRPVAWVLAAKNRTRDFYALSTAARAPGADVKALFAAADGVHRFAGVALDDPACFDFIDINPASLVQQQRALALSKKTGRPLVVTGDNYYPLPSDKGAFQAMGGRERSTPQHILDKSTLRAALTCLSDAQFKKAMATAKEIAADCASDLPAAPLIKVPGDFRAMVEKGRKSRLARGHIAKWTKAYDVRLRREVDAIEQKEFQSYFLVVADLVNWAKTKMLVGPGRGSSAGSLLCYLAGITEVDPIPHGLLFERFIDLTRLDLPDIDLDFNDQKRELVFEYLRSKYGAQNVARIGNINRLQARSVLAEICRRFEISDRERFDLVNVMIEYSSGDARYGKGIEDTLSHTDIGRRFADRNKNALVMTRLENHASHTGVHAAGVIVANVPVSDYATVGADGIAQIDKPDAETLNLLKIDALGLRTLGVIEDAGVVTPEQLYSLKLDDPKVFQIFNDQHYSAIFQFEGPAQRQVSSQVDIDSFRTIDHVTALARPGPFAGGATQKYIDRKAGRSPVATNHPRMTEILQDTYGVVIYQEQVMRIGRDIGKLTWEEVTLLRKAMSRSKGEEYFNQKEDQFLEGAATQTIDTATAKLIWREICTFGSWGMNMAHTCSYAMISYWCAWMKAYHPLEYAAACLRGAKDDDGRLAVLRELTQEGVEYVSFDALQSDLDWKAVDGRLIGGFKNFKGVGDAKAAKLIEDRKAGRLDIAKLEKHELKFADLYPLMTKYRQWYADAEAQGCEEGSQVLTSNKFPSEGIVLYIGRIFEKRPFDFNEPQRIAKRNGKVYDGNTLSIDFRTKDDLGEAIICRVDRFNWENVGAPSNDALAVGDDILVRGQRIPGFTLINIHKMMCLNKPDLKWAIKPRRGWR